VESDSPMALRTCASAVEAIERLAGTIPSSIGNACRPSVGISRIVAGRIITSHVPL
jgi:hypothetical protein